MPKQIKSRHCRRCHRALTRQESMERGYGPICAAVVGIAEEQLGLWEEDAGGADTAMRDPAPRAVGLATRRGRPHNEQQGRDYSRVDRPSDER